jgi:hypothetical protein
VDEDGERVVGLGLSLAVQIETGLDRMEATLQALGIGSVDARKMGKTRKPSWLPHPGFFGWRRQNRARPR